MDRAILYNNEPVRNLQNFLRYISYYYETVPAVIPDGHFSEQTRQSVIGFQSTFGLGVTGSVNLITWNKIIEVYQETVKQVSEARFARIFPCDMLEIIPGVTTNYLFAIQSMLYVLSQKFDNIGTLSICGTHDNDSVNLVKKIQKLCGLEDNGIIDNITFNMIANLYEVFISGYQMCIE